MRRVLLLCVWLLLAVCAAANSTNIILITLDTTRADRMGFMGSRRGLTPNLDAVARQSIVFEKAYTQAPLTTASHATILTGTYPQFHRVNDFGAPLPSKIPDIADLLHEHGYRTAAFVGSIILDPHHLAPGFDRGFDVYDAGYRQRRHGDDRYHSMERRAAEVVAHAVAWIKQNEKQPFFVWVHLYDPHDPYDPPPPFAARYAKNPYDGEIAYADAALGKLFAFLKQQNLFETTAIAFMSDHGEALGEHGESTHGIFLYDETTHVPLLLKLPAGKHAGRRVSARVRLVDVAPTLMQIAVLPAPELMQGESLLATLAPNSPERPAYSQTDYPKNGFGWSALSAFRSGKYLFVSAPRRELYDTASDPAEKNNVATKSPAVTDVLSAKNDEFRKQYSSDSLVESRAADPEQARTLAALGYVAGSATSGDPKSAGADPKDKISTANILHDAILFTETDHPEKAISLLERVLVDEPQIYVAQLQLGIAYAHMRQYAKAIPPLQKATELSPASGIGHYELGVALYETGEGKNAAQHLEKAVALMPMSADAHYSLASVYARIDRVPDAMNELRSTLRLVPDHFHANLLLGRIYFLQGFADNALPFLEKAVEVVPQNSEAHAFLAETYVQLGRMQDAEREHAESERLKRAH